MYPWKVPWHESMMQTIFSAICEKIGKSILENVLFLPFFPTLDFPNLIWIMLQADVRNLFQILF